MFWGKPTGRVNINMPILIEKSPFHHFTNGVLESTNACSMTVPGSYKTAVCAEKSPNL